MTRGFPESEYRARVSAAQARMAQNTLGALLLTTPAEFTYFTGFLTRFWESPTRPWFLIIPATGTPIAVIPSIGAHLMQQSWISDIRTWSAPDFTDDGVSLVCDVLADLVPASGKIGMPSGMETHVRLPLDSLTDIQARLAPRNLGNDAGIVRALRMIKSPGEIDKIRAACAVAERAFARVPDIAAPGVPLDQIFRQFQMLCLEDGADWVSYLAGAAGPGGYGDVISPATASPMQTGDVLMLDTGLVLDGYFCDFDRNFAIDAPSQQAQSAHSKLIEVTHAAFDAAKPGITAADLFHVMDRILTQGAGGSDVGRYGHGLGLQLTEWPSIMPQDHTELAAGMVLTLEPSLEYAPGIGMVHEENIVITETGAEFLTTPWPADMHVLKGTP